MFSRFLPVLLATTAALTAAGGGLAANQAAAAEEDGPSKITYDDHVKPIFRDKCFVCHNPDKRSGDLDLTNYTNLMQGGASGPVVEPGDASLSYLYTLVAHEDEPFMPPESPQLAEELLATIHRWLDGGALENAGSKAPVQQKPKLDMVLAGPSSVRPEHPAMPPRLSLQPLVHSERAGAVTSLAASPWSPLAAVAAPQQVLLFHTGTLQLLGVLPFPEGQPECLRFSRNGELLLAGGGRGGASGRVAVWEISTGKRLMEIGDEFDTVLAADIISDQSLVALGGPQRVVRVYSTETSQPAYELRKHTDWIYALSFSPDAVLLATADRSGGLHVWEAHTGREYLTLNGHTAAVTGLSWRADSNVLASCSEDGTIRLWEMENGNQIKNWRAHPPGVENIAFTADGRILSCGRDRVAKLWDQSGKQLRAFAAFGDLALEVAFCDETKHAIAGDWTGEIRVWESADGKLAGHLTANPPTLDQRWKEAGALLAARQQAHQKLAGVCNQAARAAADLQQTLQQAQGALQAAAAEVAAAGQAVQSASAERDQIAAQTQADSDSLEALAEVASILKQAVDKIQQATSRAPDDSQLAEAAARLGDLARQRGDELDARRNAIRSQTAAIEQADARLASASQQLQAAEADRAETSARVEQLRSAAAAAGAKVREAEQAAQAAAAEVAAAEREVQRWREEIAFAEGG